MICHGSTTGGTAKSFRQEKTNHKFAMPYFDVNCRKNPMKAKKPLLVISV